MAFPAIADTADRRRARRQERESDCGCQAVMEPLRTASPSPDEEWRAGWARTRWYPDPTYAQLGLGSGRRLASGPLLAWHSARPSLPDRSHWRLVATTIANDPCPPEKCNPPRGGVSTSVSRGSRRDDSNRPPHHLAPAAPMMLACRSNSGRGPTSGRGALCLHSAERSNGEIQQFVGRPEIALLSS